MVNNLFSMGYLQQLLYFCQLFLIANHYHFARNISTRFPKTQNASWPFPCSIYIVMFVQNHVLTFICCKVSYGNDKFLHLNFYLFKIIYIYTSYAYICVCVYVCMCVLYVWCIYKNVCVLYVYVDDILAYKAYIYMCVCVYIYMCVYI